MEGSLSRLRLAASDLQSNDGNIMRTNAIHPCLADDAQPKARALAPLLRHRTCCSATLMALAILAWGAPPAQAAVTEAWAQRGQVAIHGPKVVTDRAGNIIVTGTTDQNLNTGWADAQTIKYS